MGVIGTGATGVQTIQEVAKNVGHLTVFQLRPEWCAPLHNSKIDPEEMEVIRANYDDMFEHCTQTAAGFIHDVDPRNTRSMCLKRSGTSSGSGCTLVRGLGSGRAISRIF